ncbi:catalytic activity protein [[Candida] boidinii]|nr:catalytic activity protein [[Candida] boidinii]
MNSFNKETWNEYKDLLYKLDENDYVRVIILSGKGKNFSAGIDLKEFGLDALELQKDKVKFFKYIKDFQDCISAASCISKPTIGLYHGTNLGLALDIAVTLTMRVFTKDIKLSIKEVQVGLVADMGFLQRAPQLSGNHSLLNKLCLTGNMFGADQAARLGLVDEEDIVNDKVEGLNRCLKIAKDISKNEAWCVEGTKQCLTEMSELKFDVNEGLDNVAKINAEKLDIRSIMNKYSRTVSKKSSQKGKL